LTAVRVAYLGPFDNRGLREFFPDLSALDLNASPGMGGFGLTETVLERMRSGRPTVLITLDAHLKGPRVTHSNGGRAFYSCPRRPRGAFRDWFRVERRYIADAITESKPDVIHAHWTTEYAVAALSGGFDVPILVTARDHALDVLRLLGPGQLPSFALAMWVIRRAPHMTAVSPHVYEFLWRCGKKRLALIENAVSNCLIDEGRSRLGAVPVVNRPHLIASATRWSRLKNPKVLLRAFQRLNAAGVDAELHLCGTGMEPGGPAETWARNNHVAHRVVFRGKLVHDDVVELLRRASLYVHTSRSEAFNTAIAEAMALGVPVVAGARSGGVPYQLDYGRAGVLVDVENPAAVADGIEQMLSPGDEQMQVRRAAWSRIERLCRPSVVIEAYERIYESLIADAKTRWSPSYC